MKSGKVKHEEGENLLPKPRNQSKSEYGIMQQIYKEMQSRNIFLRSVGRTSDTFLMCQ